MPLSVGQGTVIRFENTINFGVMKSCLILYCLQKLELTADENSTHPGQLTRATFEVNMSQVVFGVSHQVSHKSTCRVTDDY